MSNLLFNKSFGNTSGINVDTITTKTINNITYNSNVSDINVYITNLYQSVGYQNNYLNSLSGSIININSTIVNQSNYLNSLSGKVYSINSGTNTITCQNVNASGEVYAGVQLRSGTIEGNYIRCNYIKSPTGQVDGPMILDPNYITNNYVRIQDKLSVNGVSEFLGNMTSTGSFHNGTNTITCGAITSTGAFNNGTNTITCGSITSTGSVFMGGFLGLTYLTDTWYFSVTNYSFLQIGAPSTGHRFNINCNCAATSFITTSDDRLKTNESLITDCTTTLLKLRPEIYDKYSNFDLSGNFTRESGFVIQEIWNIPELKHLVHVPPDANIEELETIQSIDPNNDPNYSNWGSSAGALNYNGLLAYLVKGFQEQQAVIESLKNRIRILENP